MEAALFTGTSGTIDQATDRITDMTVIFKTVNVCSTYINVHSAEGIKMTC
jgi:hypothetical protein